MNTEINERMVKIRERCMRIEEQMDCGYFHLKLTMNCENDFIQETIFDWIGELEINFKEDIDFMYYGRCYTFDSMYAETVLDRLEEVVTLIEKEKNIKLS